MKVCIFQADIHAIQKHIQFNTDKNYHNQEIIIMFDIQAANAGLL